MSFERICKPLKNKVASSDRNRLGLARKEIYLRAGINLRLKHNATKDLKKSLNRVSYKGDEEDIYEGFLE